MYIPAVSINEALFTRHVLGLNRGQRTQVANTNAAEMAEEACIGDQGRDEDDHQERGRPRRDLVGGDDEVRIRLVRPDCFHSEQQEDPHASTMSVSERSNGVVCSAAGHCLLTSRP